MQREATSDSSRPRRGPALDPHSPWWDLADVARRIRWTTKKTIRFFGLVHACVKRGGRWQTSRALIRRGFPDEWPDVIAQLTQGDEDDEPEMD